MSMQKTNAEDSGADVSVRVGGLVVTVQVERTVVLVLVVVTAHVQHNAAGIIVAVVAQNWNAPIWHGSPNS